MAGSNSFQHQDYEAQLVEVSVSPTSRRKIITSSRSLLVVVAIAIVGAFVYVNSTNVVSSNGPISFTKDEDAVKNRIVLPDMNDPDAMHDFIKTHYLLYSGFSGDMATSKATPKAKDDPNRTPETAKGAREAKKEVIESNNYLYIESFTDPNCVSTSFTGFMAYQINTCTPAWMFSYDEQKLWLKNYGQVKETKIITQTDLYSDDTCSTPVTIKPVNQTNNQACGAWNSEGNTFVKFSLKETIPLEQYGSGVLIQSHPDEDCSDLPSEILYMVSRDAECQGRLVGVCGEDEVSLTRYNDYGCQGGKADGYPMAFTKTCQYSNSAGFAKYGYATCNTADAPATIMTVESTVKFVGAEFKEGDDDKTSELTKKEQKKLAKLEKALKKAEKKGKSEKVIAKLEKKIEKAGGTVSNDIDEEEVEDTTTTVVSDEALEVMRLSKVALQNEVADALKIEPQNVEIVGEHYDSKGNNGFALKYQIVGLDDADLDTAAKKAASKSLAKSIQKAIKKDGISGFKVQQGDTSISELVPTDFYEEEIVAASKAIGKVTNIAEDSHELVRYVIVAFVCHIACHFPLLTMMLFVCMNVLPHTTAGII